MATRTFGRRRPIPWPFRLLGWIVLAALSLGVIAAAAVLGAGAYYELTRTKAGEIEAAIEERLPEGASSDQIFRFMDSRGIEHGPVEPADLENGRLIEAEVAPGTMTITGVIRNDGYAFDLVDVQLIFILDEMGALEDYVVYEVSR